MTYSHVRYAETGLVKEMRDDVRVVYGPSVNPPESRALHTLAATFLLAFAMLFAAALPAQAQTTIWSATLTPRVTFSGTPVPLGCDNTSTGNRRCSNSNTLSDDFTDDGTTYAVTKFFSRDGVLTFRLDMSATAATQGLTLVIDGEEFVLKEANQINGGKTQWKWTNTTLGWTAGTDVAVSLVVIDAPATGQPTISGAAQVNKTLTAAADYIEDPNGLPTNPTFTYQWVRVDGSTDTDIPGAASETYTLTASDLGKQIKMKVRFTDFRGHAEGPLTSNAYPPNNGTVVAAVGPCPAVNDWCATMTAAVDRDAVGYDYEKFGSLDDDQIEYRGQNINVWTVHTQKELTNEYFYFGSMPRVPRGTVVTVGEHTFTTDMESEDGSAADIWEFPLGELPPDLVWSDGLDVRISLVLGSSAPTLSIADASAAENAGHLLFEVTLSRALQNTVKVDFETISGGTAIEGVDYWAHDYTHVIPAGETTVQMGFALIEDTVDDAGETVMVRLSNARLINKRGKKKADLDITTAEATGTITAPPASTTNVPGLTIGIRDATGDEDNGWLVFKVRLSQKYDDYVCYDFETISGGTATEGMDYLKFPKATYWMQIGKRVDKPFVRIIDDSVNDNGETVKVKISNARLCNDASQTLSITRAEATGTIRNSDPLPRALMARFGRTAAVHVVEQVEQRFEEQREPGFRGQFMGRDLEELRPGRMRDTALGFLGQLAASAGADGPDPMSGAPAAERASTGIPALGSGTETARDVLGLGGGDALAGSAFSLDRKMTRGGVFSVWGRSAQSRFLGQQGALSLDGEVRTSMLGAEYARGPLVAGLSLSHSRSLGSYEGVDGGQVASSVTGLYPWVGYKATDRITLWGVTGYGLGSLSLAPTIGSAPTTMGPALKSGLSMAMAAAGTRGELIGAGGRSGFRLAFKADALWVGTSSDEVNGPMGRLAGTHAAVTRFRTGLEGSRGFSFGSGLSLVPGVEVGLRHDGGDAERGSGVDIGGELLVSRPAMGLSAEVRMRTLLVHEAEGFRERGVSVSLSFDPMPSTPLGFKARVEPSWGGRDRGGAEALWSGGPVSELAARGGRVSGGSVLTDLGYGMALGDRLIGTPRVGFGTSAMGREYRLGYSVGVLRGEGLEFELGIDAERREHMNLLDSLGSTERALVARATARW